MKRLRPIVHKDAYTVALEAEIRRYFEETIFEPLTLILTDEGIRTNSVSTALMRALDSGQIWYAGDLFFGTFNASVSRELREMGATWDDRQHGFRFPRGEMPIDLHQAIVASLDRARDAHRRIESFLTAAEENVVKATTGIQIDQVLSQIRGDLYRQLERTVPQTALEFVEVSPEIKVEHEAIISTEYRENLDKYISDFLVTEIPELRREVQANAMAGYRTDRLADLIEKRYGVSKRKAAFLADQETGLYVSKFRESRYREMGVYRYRWSTSHDDRVRADHAALDGTVHTWDSPPITNTRTGARNHPGEDYRCRCVPIPIVDLAAANEK